MQFPETVKAARRVEKSMWVIGDALLADIPARTRYVKDRLADCVQELHDLGISGPEGKQYSVSRLENLRVTAQTFGPELRHGAAGEISLFVAAEAGTPAILAKAQQMADEDGVKLTGRYARKVRAAAQDKVKRSDKKKKKPQKKKEVQSSANAVPTSTVRRHANVMTIVKHAINANKLGRKLITDIAGTELEDEERADLMEEIDDVIATWNVARDAVNNPLSREIERFLEGAS